MEAPPIVRQPNSFSMLAPDLKLIIYSQLDGRSFARLGGCSYFLQAYVKTAEKVWEQIFKNRNPLAPTNPITNWRAAVIQQGLIKRNMRANHISDFHQDLGWNLIYNESQSPLFCQGRLYLTVNKAIHCFNKKGEKLPDIALPYKPEKDFKLHYLDQNLFAAVSGNILMLIGRHTFATKHFGQAYLYDDDCLLYGDQEGATHFIDFINRRETTVENFPPMIVYLGIHENIFVGITAQYDLWVYERATKTIGIAACLGGRETHYFSYPYVVLKFRHSLLIYSFESKAFAEVDRGEYDALVSDKEGIFAHNKVSVFRWDNHFCQMIRFASSEDHVILKMHLEPKRVIALSNYDVKIWNRETGKLVLKFGINQLGTHSFIKNNILYNDYGSSATEMVFWDLTNGEILGSVNHLSAVVCADETCILYLRVWYGKKFYFFKSFEEPLPPTFNQRVMAIGQSIINIIAWT